MDMKRALNSVWEGIGPDLMDGMGGEDANPTFTGADLQNIIGDYAETYLYGEELAAWKAADWDQRAAFLKEAFPDKQLYGY